eukprot:UN10850
MHIQPFLFTKLRSNYICHFSDYCDGYLLNINTKNSIIMDKKSTQSSKQT